MPACPFIRVFGQPAWVTHGIAVPLFPQCFMEKASVKKGSASRKEETAEPKNRPLQTYREGDLSVSIWRREVNGRVFHSCSFERTYRDAKGEYRYTRYFGLDDLGRVISLAQRASEYLQELASEADA
jgi:hypothetical protein